MNIFPIEYGRSDGKVVAIKTKNGWILRCVRGPTWFWNHQTKAWDVSHRSGFRADAPHYVMPEKEALELLATIEPVEDSFAWVLA